jgi:hypothetical protein
MSADPNLLFSVVILGRMNASIHYPLWYQKTGDLITGPEFEMAMGGGVVICTPEVSQFSFGSTQVLCLPESWRVTTTIPQRGLSLAIGVFGRLRDTPVTTYGVNFDYSWNVGSGKLAKSINLADCLLGDTVEVQARGRTLSGGRTWIRFGQLEKSSYLLSNFEYDAPPAHEFSLELLLQEAFKEGQAAAVKALGEIRAKFI